jgi:hypothetical protein
MLGAHEQDDLRQLANDLPCRDRGAHSQSAPGASLTPDVVASAVKKYHVERERLAKGRARTRRAAERELAAVMRKISGVITAIESGGDPRSLALRINDLEAERRAVEARLMSRDADEVLTLHPKTAERYK